MFKIYLKTKLCYLSLQSNGEFLTELEFCEFKSYEKSCEVLEFAKNELEFYFKGKLKEFKTPLLLQGSEFEKRVYKALLEIPYGQRATYKEIALKIGHKNAYRAVGNANSKNKLPIFVPCHRVVGTNSLGGYTSGLKNSLDLKRYLLEFELKNLK